MPYELSRRGKSCALEAESRRIRTRPSRHRQVDPMATVAILSFRGYIAFDKYLIPITLIWKDKNLLLVKSNFR